MRVDAVARRVTRATLEGAASYRCGEAGGIARAPSGKLIQPGEFFFHLLAAGAAFGAGAVRGPRLGMIGLPRGAGEFLVGFAFGAFARVAGALQFGDAIFELCRRGRVVLRIWRRGDASGAGAAAGEREERERNGWGEPVHGKNRIRGAINVNLAQA